MQADRQHGRGAVAQGLQLRHDARGRDRDAAARQGDALIVRDDVDGVGDIVQIVERLAHAHEDDVGQAAVFLGRRPFLQVVAGHLDLGHDLGGGQVADQFLRAGVAEGAVQGAADLGRDAQGAGPAHVGNIDGLDLDARRGADQVFARAVPGDLTLDDLGAGQGEGLGQGRAGLLADVAHQGEVGDAVVVDPAPDLGGAHFRLLGRADLRFDQRIAQALARQTGQVDGGFNCGGSTRKVERDAQG
ncbi:hypothetical protein D3C80_1021890 [compost metagenome]